MTIKNLTKNTTLTNNAIEIRGYIAEIFGMIFHKNPSTMIFNTRFGIHTFFMKYPIDIMILNDKKQIKSLKNNLKPNKLFFWNPKYSTVIESPSGTIKKTKLEIGDFLEFI